MGAVHKAADRFRAKTTVIPPTQEYCQGDQTRPQGGERFGYREQRQVHTNGNNTATKIHGGIFPGADGSMPRMPDTRTQQDYIRRRPSTSTSSASTSVFDDEEKDPYYNIPSDADEDTDGVASLGGNRYSAPRHNARRQQHNRERMHSQWGRERRDDDGDVSSDPEQRLRRLAGNLQKRDKDRTRTRKSKR
jgi:hypothetical protein